MDKNSTQAMIIFTLGPVQRFIETARKTEDLWLGSYILSYLNAIAIQQVQGEAGIELIFPAIGGQAPFDFWKSNHITIPSFPNRFFATSDQKSLDALQDLLKSTEETVRAEFERMGEYTLEYLSSVFGRNWDTSEARIHFDRQLRNFLEIYWVISVDSESYHYHVEYDLAERRLASVKNCRPFDQVPEGGRKCSLCGAREILESMTWWTRFARRRPKYCRQGEALCAVCLTKRLGGEYFGTMFPEIRDLSFQSTSEVSTANFKSRIPRVEGASEIYTDFVEAIRNLRNTDGNRIKPEVAALPKIQGTLTGTNIDGDWLFEESFSRLNLERDYSINASTERHQIERCEQKRRELIARIRQAPSRYYAVIVLDGDGMGKTIGQATAQDEHIQLSAKLNTYTKKVRTVVDEAYLGKLVYAGGDDVLALANLSELLPILDGLNTNFPDLIEGETSTVSAGVCIAHCKVPLGEVLRGARRMEKAAKQIDGKNALGIALQKHSGNISQAVVKWDYEDLDLKTIEVSQSLITLLSEHDVSKKFIYAFREVFAKLANREGELKLPDEMISAELKRLIRRASDEKVDANQIETAIEPLVHLMRTLKFSDFSSYLEIVNFIAREGKTDATVS